MNFSFELGVNDKRLGDEDGSSILRMNRSSGSVRCVQLFGWMRELI